MRRLSLGSRIEPYNLLPFAGAFTTAAYSALRLDVEASPDLDERIHIFTQLFEKAGNDTTLRHEAVAGILRAASRLRDPVGRFETYKNVARFENLETDQLREALSGALRYVEKLPKEARFGSFQDLGDTAGAAHMDQRHAAARGMYRYADTMPESAQAEHYRAALSLVQPGTEDELLLLNAILQTAEKAPKAQRLDHYEAVAALAPENAQQIRQKAATGLVAYAEQSLFKDQELKMFSRALANAEPGSPTAYAAATGMLRYIALKPDDIVKNLTCVAQNAEPFSVTEREATTLFAYHVSNEQNDARRTETYRNALISARPGSEFERLTREGYIKGWERTKDPKDRSVSLHNDIVDRLVWESPTNEALKVATMGFVRSVEELPQLQSREASYVSMITSLNERVKLGRASEARDVVLSGVLEAVKNWPENTRIVSTSGRMAALSDPDSTLGKGATATFLTGIGATDPIGSRVTALGGVALHAPRAGKTEATVLAALAGTLRNVGLKERIDLTRDLSRQVSDPMSRGSLPGDERGIETYAVGEFKKAVEQLPKPKDRIEEFEKALVSTNPDTLLARTALQGILANAPLLSPIKRDAAFEVVRTKAPANSALRTHAERFLNGDTAVGDANAVTSQRAPLRTLLGDRINTVMPNLEGGLHGQKAPSDADRSQTAQEFASLITASTSDRPSSATKEQPLLLPSKVPSARGDSRAVAELKLTGKAKDRT